MTVELINLMVKFTYAYQAQQKDDYNFS